jgi:glycosyltransferase involved in cell wall biosynthesis
MEETDFLLLPWADRLNVPGRLYEYLATKKPIIGLVCPGSDAHDILKGSGLALLASADDGAAIARCLEQIGQNPAAAGNLVPNRASIEQYARPGLVAKYADLIRGGLAADDAPSLTEHIGSRQNER